MSSKPRPSSGNLIFWLFLLACSAGAFGAGFYFTYGHTVNINARAPGEEGNKKGTFSRPNMVQGRSPTPTRATPPAATPAVGLVGNGSIAPAVAPQPSATAGFPAAADAGATIPPDAPAATPVPRRAPPQPVATPVAVAPAPNQPEIYRVQVGPFEDRVTADRQVADLQTAGINAVVVFDGGKYQAQLGAFTDRARAISVAEEVNTRGYSVTIRH